nr:hypothetical protein [Tanacetum cinerariifolium]
MSAQSALGFTRNLKAITNTLGSFDNREPQLMPMLRLKDSFYMGTPSTGSGNLYCQWEVSPSSGNALCILFPTKTYPYYRQLKVSAAKSKFTTAVDGYCCWGFEQIIDFLNASYVKYALTVNPTVCTSCIEQFWSTAKVKNVNEEAQIQALVDKKKVIITEASIRKDLRFKDEGRVEFLSNEVIFEQLTLMEYEGVMRSTTN